MYTATASSPFSIDNDEDIQTSADVVWNNLIETGILDDYDGVLVACFSKHSLVDRIQERFPHLAVTGVFEASVITAISLTKKLHKWGIVTTGKFWERHLEDAVEEFVGQLPRTDSKFGGVFSTGLTARDFHGGHITPEQIQIKMKEATEALVEQRVVDCILMGCAGMAGLEDIIRSVVNEKYRPTFANNVIIIDGVKAGVGFLEQMFKQKRMFSMI